MNERYLFRGKTKPDGEWIYGGHMYVESLCESDITSAGDGTPDGDKIQALYMAIVALEKQTPKKPIMVGDDYSSHLSCPNCKSPIVNVWNKAEYKPNYCHYCGQKLDWSDEK